jgi:hypothetical protein
MNQNYAEELRYSSFGCFSYRRAFSGGVLLPNDPGSNE